MRVSSRKPPHTLVVIKAVELSETGKDFFLEAILEEAEEVLEVCEDGE